jgi:hypothetical protein
VDIRSETLDLSGKMLFVYSNSVFCQLTVTQPCCMHYDSTNSLQYASLISYTSVRTVIGHALEDWDTGVRYLSGSEDSF